MRGHRTLAIAVMMLMVAVGAVAQGRGRIEGKVSRQQDGKGIGGVTVVVSELGRVAVTSNDGSFAFEDVAAGSYTVNLSLGDSAASDQVQVTAGGTARLDKRVDWDVSFAETITVFSASRRRERIVEAPAAVTVIPEEEIQRDISTGQIPKLLEFTPGVETTQSGVYDFNFNTRGFNSSLNRRVVVLVDGRDPSVPFLASQEWLTVSQYMGDLASAELVRGPSSALYGANAYNGVLNLVTKQPRYSQGGELRLTGGELATRKADFRWAGSVGSNWYAKVNGSYFKSDDFSQDRTLASGVEYGGFCSPANPPPGCLNPEVRPRVVDENQVTFGNLRFDRYFGRGDFLTLEAGGADGQQPEIQTGIGRFSIPEVTRQWARVNYTANHWNFLGYYNTREGKRQTSLQSGGVTFLDSDNYRFELQTNWTFSDGKVRLVAGASHKTENINTANPAGHQTLTFTPVDSDSQAVYAQVDFDVTGDLKLVLAGRWDQSSLHDSQLSPKASLVYSINPSHSLRFTYNEAFQVANYSEFFLYAAAAPPVNLQPFEGFCAPFGVSCGFAPGPTPVLAVGNADLQVEQVRSYEVGYSGILRNKAFLTIDYYNSQLENFITDLLPNVGTALGRLNPNFGAYRPPSALPAPAAQGLLAALQGALGSTFFILSNGPDGSPILAAVSYTNFGQVDTQGVDVGLNVSIDPRWRYNFNYSFFDFNIGQDVPGDPLVPNAPENSYSTGISYVADKLDASLNYRHTEGFPWAVGTLFRGRVPSYDVVDLGANYRLTDHWQVGLNVSNLLDDAHYESFGGDLIGRRALGHVAYRW